MKHSFLTTILLVILLFAPLRALPSEIDEITFGGEISSAARRLGNEAVDLAVTPFRLENGSIFITRGVAGASDVIVGVALAPQAYENGAGLALVGTW